MTQLATPTSRTNPRWVHPWAWWVWGISAASIATLSPSPLDHIAILVAVFTVLIFKRSNGSWANAVSLLFRIALFIITFRIAIEVIFGVHFGGSVIFTLPQLNLPPWLGNIQIGGKVGLDGVTAAAANGLKLATIVVSATAPAVLVPPNLLLKAMPSAIYEAGLVTVIALGFLPTLAADAKRLKIASALRGNPIYGFRSHAKLLMPLIDSSLNRAVTLANAMESRGFGISKSTKFNSSVIGISLIGGALLLLISSVTMLRSEFDLQLFVMTLSAIFLIGIAIILSGKSKVRTKYVKQEFDFLEYAISTSGLIAVVSGIFIITVPWYFLFLYIILSSPTLIAPAVPQGFKP